MTNSTKSKRTGTAHEEKSGGLLKSLLGIRRDGGRDPEDRDDGDFFSEEENLGEAPDTAEEDALGGTDGDKPATSEKPESGDLCIPARWGVFLQVETKKSGPILYDPDYFMVKVGEQLRVDFDTVAGRDKVYEAVKKRIDGGTVVVVAKYCDPEGNPILEGVDPVEEALARSLIASLDRKYQAAVMAFKAKEEAKRSRRQAEPASAPAPAPAGSGLTEDDWAMFAELSADEQAALLDEYKSKMTLSEVIRMKALINKSKTADPPADSGT